MSTKKLALLGGKKLGPVPMDQHPTFTRRAIQRAVKLMEKGATVGLGKHHKVIEETEDAISSWQGVKHCMVVSSGHASLQVSLLGLEVGPGDEVITTPYSWGASVSCILHCGAVPVFTDCLPETGLMDPDSIEARITRRTKAILVVHIHGQPANMPAIMRIARRHRIPVVEDGSQAHGAEIAGKKVGCFGTAAGFSCMGFKLLGTSEAGYMVTSRESVYWKAALFSQHMGRSPDPGFPKSLEPFVDSLVYSYRLSPVTAALLQEQLKKVDREIAGRRKNVATLRKLMRGMETIEFPDYARGELPSYYTLSMNFAPEIAVLSRDTIEKALTAEGVPVGHYVPSPIPYWERLRGSDYRGPKTPWTAAIKAARKRYRKEAFPGCQIKIDRALDMDWLYIKPDRARMQKLADVFAKVEENLPALRDWERKQSRKGKTKAKGRTRPTRREVLV